MVSTSNIYQLISRFICFHGEALKTSRETLLFCSYRNTISITCLYLEEGRELTTPVGGTCPFLCLQDEASLAKAKRWKSDPKKLGPQFLKKNMNASRPSGHPPVRGKNVKTFRWDPKLQIQNLFIAFKRVPR